MFRWTSTKSETVSVFVAVVFTEVFLSLSLISALYTHAHMHTHTHMIAEGITVRRVAVHVCRRALPCSCNCHDGCAELNPGCTQELKDKIIYLQKPKTKRCRGGKILTEKKISRRLERKTSMIDQKSTFDGQGGRRMTLNLKRH